MSEVAVSAHILAKDIEDFDQMNVQAHVVALDGSKTEVGNWRLDMTGDTDSCWGIPEVLDHIKGELLAKWPDVDELIIQINTSFMEAAPCQKQ